MEERSEKAKKDLVKNKEVLAAQVRLAGQDEMAYDDLITDITELFVFGEAISRNKESVGTSSKALTVLFWNLGSWQREITWKVPSNLEYQKLFYKENKPDEYPTHVPENKDLFLQMIKNPCPCTSQLWSNNVATFSSIPGEPWVDTLFQ